MALEKIDNAMNRIDNRIITITLVLLLGIFLQVLLAFADIADTPARAVKEFVRAYYRYDADAMEKRLSEEALYTDENVNRVKRYVYETQQWAKAKGYSPWYLSYNLKHATTHTVEKDFENATIEFHGVISPGLRGFFEKEEPKDIAGKFSLVLADGKWKISKTPFSFKR